MIAYELLPGIIDEEGDNRRRGKAFGYLQAVFVSTVKQAVNFSHAPITVKRYEEHLAQIQAPTLPTEILGLMVRRHSFGLEFDERSLEEIPPRDPRRRSAATRSGAKYIVTLIRGTTYSRFKVRNWHPAIERLLKEDENRREKQLAAQALVR